MPRLCSLVAAAISPMMSDTCLTACWISFMVAPTLSACADPVRTVVTEASISSLISLAAVDERCASVRTSPATTAKPRPCSPARAASTAAFSARILVWKAMPSIMPVISAMRFELVLIAPIVSTIWPVATWPCCATAAALSASVLAWRALSALWRTVVVSSSMLDAVSSSDAACCSVRDDRSALPAAIWRAATPTESLDCRTSRIAAATRSSSALKLCAVRPTSSRRRTGERWLRSSVSLTCSMLACISPRLPRMRRYSSHASTATTSTVTPITVPNTRTAIALARWFSLTASSPILLLKSRCASICLRNAAEARCSSPADSIACSPAVSLVRESAKNAACCAR